MVKVALGRMGEGLANFCLKASLWFAQIGLFLSMCGNLFWLVWVACGNR